MYVYYIQLVWKIDLTQINLSYNYELCQINTKFKTEQKNMKFMKINKYNV